MISRERSLKVLWAVDPFEDLPESYEKIAGVLREFGGPMEIQPLYALSPVQLGIAQELQSSGFDPYAKSAMKALESRLKSVSLQALRTPEVLVHHRPSLRGTVEVVCGFSETQGYDFIVTGTHGRRGIRRAVLGSFAEGLLQRSRTPVLVVGNVAEFRAGNSGSILVPNDWVDPGAPIFSEAFGIAERLGTGVTLLHAIPRPIEPVFQSGVYLLSGAWVPVPVYIEKEHAKQKASAQKIRSRAEERKLLCDVIIDSDCPSVVESILSHAKSSNAGYIAMAAESGPISSALLGSITRKVIRDAPCPVWVSRKADP